MSDWREVTNSQRCIVCDKPDWCGRNGEAVRCMRIGEPPAGWRVVKKHDEGGTTFKPVDAPTTTTTDKDWTAKSERYQRDLPPHKLEVLSRELGVPADALGAVGVGWNQHSFRFTFPEKNAAGEVVGIATRRPTDGGKGGMTGGHRGLTIPDGFACGDDTVYLIEGATDVAAAMTVVLNAVGRPGNRGGVAHLAELLVDHPGEVVVLGENDKKDDGKWPGRDGAESTAKKLAKRWGRSVSWSMPLVGVKDIREWVRSFNLDIADDAACRAAGESIRQAIGENSITINPDDETALPADDGDGEAKKSQSTLLVELILAADAELFHTPGQTDSEGFASVIINGHRETMAINSKAFKRWASRLFYEGFERAPNSQGLSDAINVVAAKAIYDGAEHEVHVRIACGGDGIWLDLADEAWRAVHITPDGWRVVDSKSCPVRFIRKRGMLPLPCPERGGSIDDLRVCVNVPDENDWVLIVAWLVMAYRPAGPYPILLVNGEQGSAKSTLCRMLRQVIDPNEANLRRPPTDDRDLMIAAANSWVVGFDNLNGLSPKLSDALCTICTGGGFSTRELFSDDGEKLFNATRPVIANGIDDIASRPDLLDRSVSVTLPAIPDEQRRDEDGLWQTFQNNRAGVLGALLDAVVIALRELSHTKLERCPRMADFARWVTAAEAGLGWERGRFLEVYGENRAGIVGACIESSAIGPALRGLMHDRCEWSGSAAELLAELSTDRHSDDATRQRKDWPGSPRKMSGDLRRIQPNLRAIGIEVEFDRACNNARKRTIRIANTQYAMTGTVCHPVQYGKSGLQPSTPSTSTANPPGDASETIPLDDVGSVVDGMWTVDRSGNQPNRPVKNRPERLESQIVDGVDGVDGREPALPGGWGEA